VQTNITKFSLWAASRNLVYPNKISYPWVREFFSNEGVKKGYPLKRRHFTAIISCSVKTIADRHRHATKWLEIDQDNLHRKYSALNVNFSSSSPDP